MNTRLIDDLQGLDSPVKLAIIGIGSIGKGMVFQSVITPGMQPVLLVDLVIDRAKQCAEWLEMDYVIVDNLVQLDDILAKGKVAITDNAEFASRSEIADVVIDASSAIQDSGNHCAIALESEKHLVMMNYEADLLYGPHLLDLARKNGRIYTSCDGDQPAVIKKLINEVSFYGLEIAMAGNIKGYLDQYMDPIRIKPEADKRNLDYKMCTSYTDGTKLGVEMAVLANAQGYKTIQPGMVGPRLKHVDQIFESFDFEKIYTNGQGVVDYVLGAEPTGGIFVVGYTGDSFQQFTLDWFPPKLGPGPFYLFYRPYHLGHLESMECVAEAFLYNTSRLKPDKGYMTGVFAYAKKNLRQDDVLDGLGGFCCYGLIENYGRALENPGLPVLLSEGAKLKRDIKQDQKINFEDILYSQSNYQYRLYFESLAAEKGRLNIRK